ncbi:MAG: hypothetical protein ACWGQW_02300 [bacterium]
MAEEPFSWLVGEEIQASDLVTWKQEHGYNYWRCAVKPDGGIERGIKSILDRYLFKETDKEELTQLITDYLQAKEAVRGAYERWNRYRGSKPYELDWLLDHEHMELTGLADVINDYQTKLQTLRLRLQKAGYRAKHPSLPNTQVDMIYRAQEVPEPEWPPTEEL